MFEDKERPRKRKIQKELTNRLRKFGISSFNQIFTGEVIVLSGPNPLKATKVYRSILKKNKFILAENYKEVFKNAIEYIPYQGYKNHTLYNKDVFELILEHKNSVVGLDLDFCTRLDLLCAAKIYSTIMQLKQNVVWCRITSCYHHMPKETLKMLQIKIIRDIESKSQYRLVDQVDKGYRDGAPMNVWQFIIQKAA